MSSYNLKRLLQPKSIALFGGLWVENVATQIKILVSMETFGQLIPEENLLLGLNVLKIFRNYQVYLMQHLLV